MSKPGRNWLKNLDLKLFWSGHFGLFFPFAIHTSIYPFMWQTCVSMQSLLEIWCSTCLAVHFVAGVHEAQWLAQSIWNVLLFFQLPEDSVKAHTFAPVSSGFGAAICGFSSSSRPCNITDDRSWYLSVILVFFIFFPRVYICVTFRALSISPCLKGNCVYSTAWLALMS